MGLKLKRTFSANLLFICVCFVYTQTHDGWNADHFTERTSSGLTEHPGGILADRSVIFTKDKSPYWIRNDLIIEKNAELIIEPGVEIKFEPQVGITVRGTIVAVGNHTDRITLTTSEETSSKVSTLPEIRLVDGPSILAGRVQVKYSKKWRSVCTNSRNWTQSDMETACRQLGFQGGSFYGWFNREMPLKSRLLYEEPRCKGTENSILDCWWDSKQLGGGVCDYHPDLGIQCLPRHDNPLPYWRGLRFETAEYTRSLTAQNTLYVPVSKSRLQYVNIKYAGSGRGHNATSAIDVLGVPPIINYVDILNSAYNGINITEPESPVNIHHATIRANRGFGVFVNSSYGMVTVGTSNINENGGDGIRYVYNEHRPEDKPKAPDFCTLATVASQTYPVDVYADQTIFRTAVKECSKTFNTIYGNRLTVTFLKSETEKNDTAYVEVYDGPSTRYRLITVVPVRNNTRPQSVTSTFNQITIHFVAQPSVILHTYMRITSAKDKPHDLKVVHSDISENDGRGVAFDNLKTYLHIHNSTIFKNNHVAGLHVTSGVGDINVTNSKISFNEGDGINITYTGGNRNISRSAIASNKGYGIAIWLNDTAETEYLFVNQTTVIQYSEILKNVDIGILHGNYCGPAVINITGNMFKDSWNDALEILSCWKPTNVSSDLQIGHNQFLANEKLSIKISPALNLKATIEYNWIKNGIHGGLLIKNKPLEEFNALKSEILVQQNHFRDNKGIFVVNLGLSPYSENQYLLFTKNFVKDNIITEPFQSSDGSTSKLNPRSRVAAPVVVASNNIDIFRNIFENPYSQYELGSHLEDQSKDINCTYNWLGNNEEKINFHRIFHRNDRYNLARMLFIPFLLHNSNPMTNRISDYSRYVPYFNTKNSNKIGGEVEGEENLSPGEYFVEKDINIRPGGKLTLDSGVTLLFPPSVGMMVGGKLEARGGRPDSIRFTLKEEIKHPIENDTYESDTEIYNSETEIIEIEPAVPIRLLGGSSSTEGRLQLRINGEWGTVCNYGWTMRDAALVCQQLGLVLNSDDWFLERSEIPTAGTTEEIILSNVQCEDYDLDITKCKADRKEDFENSCTHENDVGIRCYDTSWAGVRFGSLSERSDIQYITIEKAGLLDYATNTFKPALQLDFARHNFDSIKVSNNFHDGLGIMYSDIYTGESVNTIKNSEFSNNKGSGVSFKQLGLKIYGSLIENNKVGIEHNPALTGLQQRELAGWYQIKDPEVSYRPFSVPEEKDSDIVIIREGETKYLVTSKVSGDSVSRSYRFRCNPGYVVGIQLLNPIENRSTESIKIHDSHTSGNISDIWVVARDLSVFPTTSSSHGVILDYNSGTNALGGTVIALSTIRAPVQDIYNKIVKGPVPTVTLSNTKIRQNIYGVHASYYNRYLNELGDHFLRKANESLRFINCEISHNKQEAIFVHSPHWDLHKSNISEITFMINSSLIIDNGKGIFQFSRDMRASNNLFHYILQDDTIERNKAGGFDISLPYVWQYNENFTHSVYMGNVTWRDNLDFGINIDGHYAIVNITKSLFMLNRCKYGLISVRGMEKKMLIDYNTIENNNGKYMVEFSSSSQSEIIGQVPAKFVFNTLRKNGFASTIRGFGVHQMYNEPTCIVGFKGIQKVKINRNLFSSNNVDYQLIAGIKTAKVNSYLDVTENWWGTTNESSIESTIFDFDDWNNHAIAQFRPFLIEESFYGSHSVEFAPNKEVDLDNLGGRLTTNVTLYKRDNPYIIRSDVTVMPKAILTINPGVEIEFAPNVGILVLGSIQAKGLNGYEITMKPLSKNADINTNRVMEKRDVSIREKRQLENFVQENSIRLCKGWDCIGNKEFTNEGFLEYFNKTTLQWIPMCDPRFTERNAQVVCRELGFDPINSFFDHDVRIEFHSNSLTRIWSWPEPLQCIGTEMKYEDCPIRLNGQQFGHRHECKWDSKFVFIHCGERNIPAKQDYWGGIRFADSEFEHHMYNHRIHDVHTHDVMHEEQSTLEFVKIIGAGVLHNEKSPAVQSIVRSPKINYVSVAQSASHGIYIISPTDTMNMISNSIEDSLGIGLNILSLTGEGREGQESSFTPLKSLNLPYNLFSLVDICDTEKEIRIEERVLVYYKYDNHPVNCVKIFRSAYNIKPFGFRLLQFNLFNSTTKYGIPDYITLYDGDIYNVSSKVITTITTDSRDERKMFATKEPSLSIKLFANGASSDHGFIAEIVTLPISAIGFNREIQSNISDSAINNNKEGGLLYMSAGEVHPIVTIDRNQFRYNGRKLYGNFTTCKAAVDIDVQNTQLLYFRNNLLEANQGGLSIKSDSRSSATSLKGYIHNNLFVKNMNHPALYVEGRQSSPYQEVTIYRNYFTRNYAEYANNIILKQVVSNFTFNYVKRNIGLQNVEISGFDKVRLPIYQSTTHNGFYDNYAVFRDGRSTIVAGTAGQHYVDNIFFNPDNDYEMITVNRSLTLELWKTKIDAPHNYWGLNTTFAVEGRIRDQRDDTQLLEVNYTPYYMNNKTILNGKCPPGWDLVGDTCYIYIGAPMTFHEARAFCAADNASMPFLIGNINYYALYDFLTRQQQWYLYSDRVWIQHIDKVNECTTFVYQTVEVDDCSRRSSFICEIDPKVIIDPLAWHGDVVTIAVIGSVSVAILLIALILACWWTKSKYRHAQRLERRNSIRQSLHSLRSVGSTNGFSDFGYRRKPGQLSTRSTDTLTKTYDYNKMLSDGSIDSMEKSTIASSVDENQSYDVYETNPTPRTFKYPTIEYHKQQPEHHPYAQPYKLAYKNEGFKDNSTFASNSNYQSRAESIQDNSDETPIIHSPENGVLASSYPPSEYYNTDTLPLHSSKGDTSPEGVSTYTQYFTEPKPASEFLQELKNKLPQTSPYHVMDLPSPPDPPRHNSPTYAEKLNGMQYSPDYLTLGLPDPPDQPRPSTADLLETFNQPEVKPTPKPRAKSEALLETNFDYIEPETQAMPLSEMRSKSQPLETAM